MSVCVYCGHACVNSNTQSRASVRLALLLKQFFSPSLCGQLVTTNVFISLLPENLHHATQMHAGTRTQVACMTANSKHWHNTHMMLLHNQKYNASTWHLSLN